MKRITIGSITIDPERFLVLKNETPIVLTKTEFDILYLLMNNAGKVYSRRDISKYVWGKEEISFPRTIDVHICNIRKKIGKVGNQNIIVVHKKVGYKYNEPNLDHYGVFPSASKETNDSLRHNN